MGLNYYVFIVYLCLSNSNHIKLISQVTVLLKTTGSTTLIGQNDLLFALFNILVEIVWSPLDLSLARTKKSWSLEKNSSFWSCKIFLLPIHHVIKIIFQIMAKLNIQQETFDNYVKENIEDLGKFQHFSPHAIGRDSQVHFSLSHFLVNIWQSTSSN